MSYPVDYFRLLFFFTGELSRFSLTRLSLTPLRIFPFKPTPEIVPSAIYIYNYKYICASGRDLLSFPTRIPWALYKVSHVSIYKTCPISIILLLFSCSFLYISSSKKILHKHFCSLHSSTLLCLLCLSLSLFLSSVQFFGFVSHFLSVFFYDRTNKPILSISPLGNKILKPIPLL